ncbi:hypothetical protein BS47DRAFT_1322788 [Hydnum rufescens UP504]|uniref:BAG domain-containing protein n=1 Tax=Hydnum rufescens UP504 TaxID=1448309 RepID=A0A9P6ADA9_9AGAM|nr:hypothetical protein BS47DRAFT_1322788 [Hydnum rufescens UP504]
MSFLCKWGKERIRFQLPADPSTPLHVVREMVAQHTGLPSDRFKMIHSGAIMKDDNAPISSYHLVANSVIAIIGSGERSGDLGVKSSDSRMVAKNTNASPTEQWTLKCIQAEVDTIRTTLKPSVDAFLASLASDGDSTDKESKSRSSIMQTHAYLSEMLLQSLLRLDAIVPEGEWLEVRSARKEAVKEVQSILDRLDDGRGQSYR